MSKDLVVGDIITIEAGMRIPADCILLEGMDIKCDESMYDKFSKEVPKKQSIDRDQHEKENPNPFLLSRSLVLSGSGRAVVCAVWYKTRWFAEHPVEDLEDDNEKTPLSQRLEKLAEVIQGYAYVAAFFILFTLVLFLVMQIMFSD